MSEKIEQIKKDKTLYLFLAPMIIFFIIYHFLPMFNMRFAFYDYSILGDSLWVGLDNFKTLMGSPSFIQVLKNTILISGLKILLIFPLPIILALMFSEIPDNKFKVFLQSTLYLPHFLSWVIIAGIWISLLSTSGPINGLLNMFGNESIDFMTSQEHIIGVLIGSEIWRVIGWDSIIYIAAMGKISSSLYEAAKIDGANRLKRIIYITLPELKKTIIVVLTLNLGFFLSAGFDQIFNFSNSSVLSRIDIIDTYVYRIGLVGGQIGMSLAAGLFKGVIGLVLILLAHNIAKKTIGEGLW